MCGGGGGGPSPLQLQLQVQQMAIEQQTAAAQLEEQKREFGIQQTQADQSLANQKALQDTQAAQVKEQADLTEKWQTGRAGEAKKATDSINDAFAQFTPDYYKNFTQAYVDNYTPQIQRQFDKTSNATTFGLARTGNAQSQTAANQFGELQTQKGQAEADVNNQAIAATTQEKQNVLSAKQSLTAQATSDATLGSPITPGSIGAINANFDTTSSALARIQNSAGDTITTLQATPQYSSLGSLFGTAASSASAAINSNTNYGNLAAFNSALGAANPSSRSSGRVS